MPAACTGGMHFCIEDLHSHKLPPFRIRGDMLLQIGLSIRQLKVDR